VKAITVRQPWAQLIAEGVKTIEWRTRPTSYRGPILIHAAKAKMRVGHLVPWYEAGFSCEANMGADGYWGDVRYQWATFPLGAVVAVANLTDCLPVGSFHHGDWDRLDPNPPTRDVDYINTNVEAIAEGLCESPDASPLAIHHTRVSDKGSVHWSEPIPDQVAYSGGYAVRGNFGYLLSDVRRLGRPVPAKGALGLWTAPDDVVAAVVEQIGELPCTA